MIVLKDKKDIKYSPSWFLKDYEWESHGQYDSLDFVNPEVKVLSVQFTKVGEKTYKAFPNLEWIIIRQHGFDNVNLAECEKRSIGVVTTKPFAQSTADWINSFIEETLVVTVPPRGNDKLIGEKILSNFKGKLISVSRSTVIDNEVLYKHINNISHAYVDTLDDHLRQELLDTGKVTYTKHTAFAHGFSYENNPKYFAELEEYIIDCLSNTVNNPLLSRQERITF